LNLPPFCSIAKLFQRFLEKQFHRNALMMAKTYPRCQLKLLLLLLLLLLPPPPPLDPARVT
jgi:hypothetical protein